jgi:hypothetical protein
LLLERINQAECDGDLQTVLHATRKEEQNSVYKRLGEKP